MSAKDSIRKTIAYAKRNGIVAAWYAAKERMQDNRNADYTFVEISEAAQCMQQKEFDNLEKSNIWHPLISIVVPCYKTPEVYLRELIECVQDQTYGRFELILADASPDDSVQSVALRYADEDKRIIYRRLESNGGISDNTNAALEYVRGDYVALLDHDDLLTPDALFEMARVIMDDRSVELIYSDEDKTNSDGSCYYECHVKPDFNLDYLLSNNYICHFTVIKAEIIKELKLRKNYDGAQDFDLFLRVCSYKCSDLKEIGSNVRHINRILYHWRCHEASTAVNPNSKAYAYTAGKRAVQDFMDNNRIAGKVRELPHVGFYRTEYTNGYFSERPDVGIVGGKLTGPKGVLVGGAINADGSILYEGLPKGFSGGFQHRAVLQQDVDAVDVRYMMIAPNVYNDFRDLFTDLFGVVNVEFDQKGFINASSSGREIFKNCQSEAELIDKSIKFCAAVRSKGYRILWDPRFTKKV